MGKRFTGASAYIDAVVAEGGEVRITAVAGTTRATTVARLGNGFDVEALVAAETEAAMVLAEMIDAGVDEGTAATAVSADEDEGLREGFLVGRGGLSVGGSPLAGLVSRADMDAALDLSPEGLKRRKAFANALISSCKAAEGGVSVKDWIRANCRAAGGQDVVATFGNPEPDNDLNAWDANIQAHAAELRAERAERRVAILERAASSEFEWEGSVDVGTFNSPAKVLIRTTQEGFEAIEAAIGRLRREVDEASVRAACADEVARALDASLRRYENATKAIARLAAEAA